MFSPEQLTAVEGKIMGIGKILGATILTILVTGGTFTYLSHGVIGHEAAPKVRKIHKPVVKQNINAPVQPQSVLAKSIDQQVKATGRSGTLLVAKAGKIILNQGYGLANKQTNQPATTQSLYGIASLQKNLTALLVMQQVAAGKIKLTDKVSQYLPQLPAANTVTVQQLLNMTAGYNQIGKTEATLDEAGYEKYALSQLVMDQRGAWYYSAGNYVALVGILRQVTGRSYADLLKETFKGQHHIDYTDYNDFIDSPYKTANYGADGTAYFDNPNIFNREIGTGSIEMTTGNLYKLLRDELSNKIISKLQFNAMMRLAPNETYASGMYDDGNAYRMHGIILGFEPSVKMSKDGKNMVIWLSNEDTTKVHTNVDLVNHLYDSLLTVE